MKKLKRFLLPVLSVISLIVVIAYTVEFSDKIYSNIGETIFTHLTETSVSRANSVKTKLNEQIFKLKTVAEFLSAANELGTDSQIELLYSLQEHNGFLRTAIAFPDGSFVTHDRETRGSVSDREFFVRSMNGEDCLLEPGYSLVDTDKVVFFLSVPIIKDEQVFGSVLASYEVSMIEEILSSSFLNGAGNLFLCKSNGDKIAGINYDTTFSLGNNVFNFLETVNSKQNVKPLAQMRSSMKRGVGGTSSIYNDNKQVFYVSYTPVGINDWFAFSIVSQETLLSQLYSISKNIYDWALVVSICIMVLLGYVIYLLFIRNRSVITTTEKLKSLENLYEIFLFQTESSVFVYDDTTKKVKWSENCKKEFVYLIKNIVDFENTSFFTYDSVWYEDVSTLKKLESSINFENNTASADVRIKYDLGAFKWSRISVTFIYNENKIPIKIIGSIANIHREKHQTEMLKHKATKDPLTGLYNKATTEILVTEILESGEKDSVHAMISADIDHFKNINDSFGHLFGDGVLSSVANGIKGLFRSTDILGRFGGDEFVLFIRDIPSMDFIKEKADELIKYFEKSYRLGDTEHKISLSVGIAIYPKHGATYEELYKNADESLYQAKRAGKDMYCIFGESINDEASTINKEIANVKNVFDMSDIY